MNYSRILAAALLCSTIGIAHASHTSATQTQYQRPQVSAQNTFNSIVEKINTAHEKITKLQKNNDLNKNNFKETIGVIRTKRMDAAWKALANALNDPIEVAKITAEANLAELQKKLADIQTASQTLGIDPENAAAKRFNDVAQKLLTVCNSVKPAEKTTPTSDADKGLKKPEEPKNNDDDKDKNKDPKNDPVNNAGFCRTYLFNAKTGVLACLLAGAYWYYTSYMQSEEPTLQESSPAEIEVTEQAVQ